MNEKDIQKEELRNECLYDYGADPPQNVVFKYSGASIVLFIFPVCCALVSDAAEVGLREAASVLQDKCMGKNSGIHLYRQRGGILC